jgi:hypothetical protein
MSARITSTASTRRCAACARCCTIRRGSHWRGSFMAATSETVGRPPPEQGLGQYFPEFSIPPRRDAAIAESDANMQPYQGVFRASYDAWLELPDRGRTEPVLSDLLSGSIRALVRKEHPEDLSTLCVTCEKRIPDPPTGSYGRADVLISAAAPTSEGDAAEKKGSVPRLLVELELGFQNDAWWQKVHQSRMYMGGLDDFTEAMLFAVVTVERTKVPPNAAALGSARVAAFLATPSKPKSGNPAADFRWPSCGTLKPATWRSCLRVLAGSSLRRCASFPTGSVHPTAFWRAGSSSTLAQIASESWIRYAGALVIGAELISLLASDPQRNATTGAGPVRPFQPAFQVLRAYDNRASFTERGPDVYLCSGETGPTEIVCDIRAGPATDGTVDFGGTPERPRPRQRRDQLAVDPYLEHASSSFPPPTTKAGTGPCPRPNLSRCSRSWRPCTAKVSCTATSGVSTPPSGPRFAFSTATAAAGRRTAAP